MDGDVTEHGETQQHEVGNGVVRRKPTAGKHRLAGMALRNGVLVIGPTHWAAAVRDDEGNIVKTSQKRPTVGGGIDAYPALRGPVRLVEMLLVLPAMRQALPQARLAFESAEVATSTLVGSLAARLLRARYGSGPVAELASSATGLAVMLATMRGGEIAQYHGAEHKAIGGYELDIPAREASKEHDRCGTHLAVPLVLANAVAAEGARLLLPGRPATSRALGLAAGVALATEFARSTQRQADTALSRLSCRIGTGLQSIASTSEPTDEQLEVADAALQALLEAEQRNEQQPAA